MLVLTIYFMAAFDRLSRRRLRAGAGVPAGTGSRLIGDEILAKVGAYMVGALAIALLAGASTFVFAMIVGLAYPFALAVVVAISDLIPQIGATLGAVVVSLVGFATGAGRHRLRGLLRDLPAGGELPHLPQVMRRSVQVNDVAAIVAALLGVALLGVIGALIAIPAVAAIQLIVREVVLPRQEQH